MLALAAQEFIPPIIGCASKVYRSVRMAETGDWAFPDVLQPRPEDIGVNLEAALEAVGRSTSDGRWIVAAMTEMR